MRPISVGNWVNFNDKGVHKGENDPNLWKKTSAEKSGSGCMVSWNYLLGFLQLHIGLFCHLFKVCTFVLQYTLNAELSVQYLAQGISN